MMGTTIVGYNADKGELPGEDGTHIPAAMQQGSKPAAFQQEPKKIPAASQQDLTAIPAAMMGKTILGNLPGNEGTNLAMSCHPNSLPGIQSPSAGYL